MTGTDIDIKVKESTVEWVLQKGNAFIISQDSIEGFNQIKGKDITSIFKDGDIHHVNVDGDQAETIYWIRDDDGGLIGIDVSKSATMVIEMENQNVSLIKSYKGIDETMYPEADLQENSRYLQGFKWHKEARPTDKDDIFRRIEAEMPQAAPQVTPTETTTETPTEPKAEVQEEQSPKHRPKRNNSTIQQ